MKSTSEPLKYRRVFDTLRGEILSGRYKAGEKFPSEARLVKRFGISRITIGRAVRELQEQGLVERRAGSGTYVRAARTEGLTFGLLIPNLGQTDIFEPICQGMADAAQSGGHALLWGHASGGPEDRGEQALRLCGQYIDRKVAGVFFAPLEFTGDDEAINRRIVEALERARIPIVLLDRCYLPYPRRGRHDLVGIDNRRAGFLITEHLLQLGAERIVFVSAPHSAPTVDARISGFREALLMHGQSPAANAVQRLDPGNREAVRALMEAASPDAFVCANDRTAASLMHTLLGLGIRIPGQARLAGIDDTQYARLLPVPLTTVHQPCRQIGVAAMSTMLERLERPGMPSRDVLLACRLVTRASCGAAIETAEAA